MPEPAAARLIAIHPAAPPKPAWGQSCNGCGVCCLQEPCPVGALLSLRRHGACDALRWSDAAGRYHCGLLSQPADVLPRALRPLSGWLSRRAHRWIAAGIGCDCDSVVEVEVEDQD
ncbi:hypothetical protein [Leptothrix discophora]|uniref:4Fe-4S ferredoxin-type domain-containing protein n=1 Tax=Leptothrix discophora TaxID=89 RepID=A0ABT9FZK5_LEPDI|nr:hypothetical protein [Leptothrix discophora]MDP4299662.1 hypothetical protein [Leptothrix discophora]